MRSPVLNRIVQTAPFREPRGGAEHILTWLRATGSDLHGNSIVHQVISEVEVEQVLTDPEKAPVAQLATVNTDNNLAKN
ncbi:MAG TPA: hypothetical protein DC045_16115 [Marinobacter adhaerens]|uniref:Uncharacterized protein n=1 Tax=Marinobacter adhaerens TaxID=1033846 RepID=A0A352IWF8_9GAMM|nr:hypothetical protein [Marinobacter sp.]HBC35791.1 hypothetical protein [Marinobacter adhaerens]